MNSPSLASRQTGRGFWFLIGILWVFSAQAAASLDDDVETGRRIYQDGVLPSGDSLKGTRLEGTVVSGTGAACITCHYRSGMGFVEGDIQVSPIAGNYLFGTGEKTVATMDPRSGKAFNQKHPPYTDESLAAAIRTGMNNRGQPMNPVMPRYDLNEPQMKALTAYLRQLSASWSPGVTADTIRFATVITPDVDPQRRKALLDTLRSVFAQRTVQHCRDVVTWLLRRRRCWAPDANGNWMFGNCRGLRRHGQNNWSGVTKAGLCLPWSPGHRTARGFLWMSSV